MPLVYSFSAPGRDEFACAIACQQCSATAANGQRCRKRACLGVPMCWVHMLKEYTLRYKRSTIPGAGKGLFAMKRGAPANEVVFKKDSLIVRYFGEIVTMAELDRRYGPQHTAPYGMKISAQSDRYEDAACKRGTGALANHSSNNANARLSWTGTRASDRVGTLRALRNIRNGEEILVNYGNDYNLHEPGVRSRTVRRRTV